MTLINNLIDVNSVSVQVIKSLPINTLRAYITQVDFIVLDLYMYILSICYKVIVAQWNEGRIILL